MVSGDPAFGSYSALVAREGELLAFSDRGGLMVLPLPNPLHPGSAPAVLRPALLGSNDTKGQQDIESATLDVASGRIWLGYEGSNAVARLETDLTGLALAQPAAMRGWTVNNGAEAMVRLADGRFIILAESSIIGNSGQAPGLLFPGDPVDGAKPQRFRFVTPGGFSATDMVQLPDGRVVILLRAVSLLAIPPHFSARLVVADPARIKPGKPWVWTELARFAAPAPLDNYEGLALDVGADGRPVLWIVSDDNGASVIQRSLLLRLEWALPEVKPAKQKARSNAARLQKSEPSQTG
jgi:hypothetical protein